MVTEKLVYSIPELAQIFHIGEETARRLVKEGQIPGLLRFPFKSTKILISKVQVDAFLAGEKLEDIKKRFKIQKREEPKMRKRIKEKRLTEARKLFDANPNWGWEDLSRASGINPSTLRHIFKKRWGLTTRGREQKSQVIPIPRLEENCNHKEDDLSVASFIGRLSELIKRLQIERDAFEEQVGLLETSLKEKGLKIEELMKRGNKLAVSITEAQELLAQENRRTH